MPPSPGPSPAVGRERGTGTPRGTGKRREAWFAPYVRHMKRYVRRRPVFAAACTAAALVLASSGLSYAAVDHYTAAIAPVPAFDGLTDRPKDDGATNILVVGSDDRSGLTTERRLELSLGLTNSGRRTDTILMVHITSGGAVDIVSIPRDSAVDVAAHVATTGEDIDDYRGKINSSYSSGGPSLLVGTLEQATGVHVDHYLEVSFEGFVDIVDALGGVEVCTEEPINDELSGLVLPAGKSVVDGDMGLSYVRARYFDPTADYGRMARQQAFLGAMARKAASASVLFNPFRANSTVNAALASISADPALSDSEVRKILRQLRSTTPADITFHSVPVAGDEYLDDGSLAVVWDRAGSEAMFAALRENRSLAEAAQRVQDDARNDAQDDNARDKEAAGPLRSEIPVVVLNGNGTPGVATDAGNAMAAVGHPVVSIGNAEVTDRSVIAYPPGAKEQARKVAQMLPDARLSESDDVTDITITLGTDFTQLADVPAELPEDVPEDVPEDSPADLTAESSAESASGSPDDSGTLSESEQPVAGTGFVTGTGADSLCS